MEYLDERFPHPPLLPPDPINRARFRMALTRINEDWYSLLQSLDSVQSEKVRKSLHDSLVAASAIFSTKPFFLSEEFSLLDCSLGPLLWRLPHYQIRLPTLATPVLDYAERIFSRR
jgi:RNA polymerase-associated protein